VSTCAAAATAKPPLWNLCQGAMGAIGAGQGLGQSLLQSGLQQIEPAAALPPLASGPTTGELLLGGLGWKAGLRETGAARAFSCFWGSLGTPFSLAWGTGARGEVGCRNRLAKCKPRRSPCASRTARGSAGDPGPAGQRQRL